MEIRRRVANWRVKSTFATEREMRSPANFKVCAKNENRLRQHFTGVHFSVAVFNIDLVLRDLG